MRKFLYGRYKTSLRPDATPDLSWNTTVISPGSVGDKWTAKLMEMSASTTVIAGDTPTTVADRLAAAIDALPGITSTNSGAVITTVRTVTPTLELDVVSHLTIEVERQRSDDGGPYPSPSRPDGTQYLYMGGATGGTFTLTFGGQTTAAIAYNASAAAVEAALELLPNVDADDVAVTLPEAGFYAIAWRGRWGADVSLVPLLVADGTAITGETTQPVARHSTALWTNVVATEAAISLGEFAVYRSVPQA